MAIIIDVPVNTTWVDINTTTSIAVGTALQVMNKGNQGLFLTESVAEPATLDEGVLLTSIGNNYAVGVISSGSLRIWCRCNSALGSTVAVQDVS